VVNLPKVFLMGRESRIHAPTRADGGHVPLPPREIGPALLAGTLALAAVAVLAAALTGAIGGGNSAVATPPRVLAVAPTPTPALAAAERARQAVGHAGRFGRSGPRSIRLHRARALEAAEHGRTRAVAALSPVQQDEALSRFAPEGPSHIFERWVAGFYPIYATAQRTFDVNWLLIASIHKQESAFSTAPSTYHGLNFAHCCGGPMQFNVTNGPLTTWGLVRGAYRYARRPYAYDHMTAKHPSIYDDFDSIMAAAWLLSANGARFSLGDGAWWAAYDYYGHDTFGVSYADDVLARAIGWSQHGFCINCASQPSLIEAVHRAYGAPVLASLEAQERRDASTRRAAKARAKARRRLRAISAALVR
jgi:hypothetical protein